MSFESRRHADLFSRFPAQIVGATSESARYHVFNAPNSVCSQKVRAVFFAAEQPFASHLVDIFKGQNYDPLYVGTRAQACLDAKLPLAATHPGSTSVAGTGCDACVVPTLIDGDTDETLVDSLRICIELSGRFGGELLPARSADAIDREIAVVDALPNYPLLAAKVSRPTADGSGNAFAMSKVERCDRLIEEHADDALLVAAYAAKRDKELSANAGLFSADAIAAAEREVRQALIEFSGRLPKGSRFLYGDGLSLADIFWAIALIRTEDLGYGDWIGQSPRLASYFEALCAAPAIRAAIIDWPGSRIKLHAAA